MWRWHITAGNKTKPRSVSKLRSGWVLSVYKSLVTQCREYIFGQSTSADDTKIVPPIAYKIIPKVGSTDSKTYYYEPVSVTGPVPQVEPLHHGGQ